MLDYTKMLIDATIKDIKRIRNIANYSSQGFTLVYLVYALIAGTGFWFINAPLLALAIAYLVYDLHNTNHTLTKEDKLKNKKVKRLFKRIKQAIKLFPLCVALYNLCLTFENPNIFSLLSTAFMLIAWLITLVFDILTVIFETRLNLFKEAIQADIEEVTKPFREAGNFFKKVTGQEVTTPTISKQRALLDEQVVEYRKEKADKKEEAKQAKKEERKRKSEVFWGNVRSKFTESKLLKGAKNDEQTPTTPQLPEPKNENGDEE